MPNQGVGRSCCVGAKTEMATARGSGHLQKECLGLAETGCGPWEGHPRIVKTEMGCSQFKSWVCFLLCDLEKVM